MIFKFLWHTLNISLLPRKTWLWRAATHQQHAILHIKVLKRSQAVFYNAVRSARTNLWLSCYYLWHETYVQSVYILSKCNFQKAFILIPLNRFNFQLKNICLLYIIQLNRRGKTWLYSRDNILLFLID